MSFRELQVKRPRGLSADLAPQDFMYQLLSNPHIAQVLPRLSFTTLLAMVSLWGVEDCTEILPFLSQKQRSDLLDHHLWTPTPYNQDRLEPDEVIRWIGFYLTHDEECCRLLEELGKQTIAAFVCLFADVFPLLGKTECDPYEYDVTNDENFSPKIYQAFSVSFRADEQAECVICEMLDRLNEEAPEFLQHVLEHCAGDGRWSEAERRIEEEIVEDLAAERERRLQKQGFLTEAQAAEAWQGLWQGGNAAQLRKVLLGTEELLGKRSERNDCCADASEADDGWGCDPVEVDHIVHACELFAARVHENSQTVLCLTEDREQELLDAEKDVSYFVRELCARCPDQEGVFFREASALANMLVSRCRIFGKALDPQTAARAVRATCDLGFAHMSENLLISEGIVGVFQQGLRRLREDVSLKAAAVLDDLVRRRTPETALLRECWVESVLRRGMRGCCFGELVQKFQHKECAAVLSDMEWVLPRRISFFLQCFLGEFPVCPVVVLEGEEGQSGNRDYVFFKCQEQIKIVAEILSHLQEEV